MFKGKIKKGAKNSVFEVKVFLFTLEGKFIQQRYDEITNSSYLATNIDNKNPTKFWSVDFGGYVYMYVTSDLNTSNLFLSTWMRACSTSANAIARLYISAAAAAVRRW